MPEISAPLAAAVAATSLLAAVVGGVTGMSTGIIAIPVLAFAFGVRLAVPIITVAMLFNTFSRCVANRDYVDWRAVRWYSLGAVPAAALGAAVFAYIPADLLARGLGAFLLALVAYRHLPVAAGRAVPLRALAAVGVGQASSPPSSGARARSARTSLWPTASRKTPSSAPSPPERSS